MTFFSTSKKKAFTLLEVIITMMVFFFVVTVITSLFIEMIKIKWWLDARQYLTRESYYLLEKLQVLSKNYTIDYEEYWNRQQVGCVSPSDPQWSGSSHCTMMTYYGNDNSFWPLIAWSSNYHMLYSCSSVPASSSYIEWLPVVYADISLDASNFSQCAWQFQDILPQATLSWFIQSYGQYKKLFIDVQDDVDNTTGAVQDDDDLDRWDGPVAVYDATGVQELYLISHDGTNRLLIRKKLLEQWDRDNSWLTWDSDNEKLYTLQILQLKGLDAWQKHDFDTSSSGVYDGQIDTWVCDSGAWFICHWFPPVGWAYTWYYLPATSDDGWINLFASDMTITDRNILITPTKDPDLARKDTSSQISPSLQIQFIAKLYGKNRSSKIPRSQMNNYSIRLQTLFNVADLGNRK
jgi:hypothetical protein